MNYKQREELSGKNFRQPFVPFIACLLFCMSASCMLIEEGVLLDIPDRAWDPQRPDLSVSWCTEACIQMALAFYGLDLLKARPTMLGIPIIPTCMPMKSTAHWTFWMLTMRHGMTKPLP